MKLPPLYRVHVHEHRIAGRFTIPHSTTTLPAVSATDACTTVIRWQHGRACVPPWQAYVRASLQHTSATPADAPPLDSSVSTDEPAFDRVAA